MKGNKENTFFVIKHKWLFFMFTFYQLWQTSHMGICVTLIYDNARKTMALIIGLTKTINLSLNTSLGVIIVLCKALLPSVTNKD